MPTILRVHGYRFFFFSNEGDVPPHIHVESADNYAKFWLNPVTLAKSVGFNARQLGNLREIIEKHRNLFKERWDEYFGSY
ncbi:hypothetical protein CH333_01730 [candidate division WOR-3 bacterium JGI_Cruoil_03_44_89]|uniref:DUF4160 domain-containing protein n=1 Tax=candidate division WOR-3 bacterium JGI_Cruoil_03_44_89 TaxID=1973748 RepID=A0A235BYE1_UNCW3|nr:MAG: hypothetical protein CH333_01730 [candidate division WOR-3 bacterium JGI_Cruoil_03_44_89]